MTPITIDEEALYDRLRKHHILCDNIQDRDKTPADYRWVGMNAIVINPRKTYILGPGLTNVDWVEVGK